jgi:hypothetical protein
VLLPLLLLRCGTGKEGEVALVARNGLSARTTDDCAASNDVACCVDSEWRRWRCRCKFMSMSCMGEAALASDVPAPTDVQG